MPPVCSPTAIMEITIGGNTLDLASGWAIVSPPAIDARDSITALWITILPAVRAVISRPSRIDTPEEISVPSVRVKRDTADVRSTSPSTGSRISMRAISSRPRAVLKYGLRPIKPLSGYDGGQDITVEIGDDLVLGLLCQDVERLQPRQPGVDPGGDLPRHHYDVAPLDAAAELEAELELARRGADLHHHHAVLPQVGDDVVAARQVDLVVDEIAFQRARGVLEDRHSSLPPGRLAARRDLGRSRLRLAGGGLAFVLRRLADHPQEFVRVRRDAETLVFGDFAAQVELVQGVVQRLHAVLLPRLHHGRDLLDLLVPNQGTDGGRHDEDFARHHAAAAFGLLQRSLRDDALEHERELGADLRLLMRREHVDDAVDALHRRVGVQRGEGEVARLGDRQRRRNRLEVAHFADQHHVGVLPQRVLERGREAVGIRADLALVHDAGLVAVDELDRVLHRDDVPL